MKHSAMNMFLFVVYNIAASCSTDESTKKIHLY